jgi:hypothetical protein
VVDARRHFGSESTTGDDDEHADDREQRAAAFRVRASADGSEVSVTDAPTRAFVILELVVGM